jgi:hypothetical protein
MRYVRNIILCLVIFGLVLVGGDSQPLHESDPFARYKRMVANAKTQTGVFTIHQVDDLWFMEIPPELLGRDFFWYSELSKAPAVYMSGLGAVNEKMVTFEQQGDNIIVYERSSVVTKRAGPEEKTAENLSVAQSALPAVLFSFPIAMHSPAGAPVIEVSHDLDDDLTDFSVGAMLGARSDPDRSFIERIDAYPNNIGISTLLTFSLKFFGEDANTTSIPAYSMSISALVRHNITLLPEEPAPGRYADPRVGYFTTYFEDYSGERDPDMVPRELITRFRLEKKDPNAEVSEPVTPIIFYISREVPERWRPYIKQGIEDWQVAFEAAGFKNAILARDAPSPDEDPQWDPADTRYSVIRWVAQPVANALGPSTVDPRSGEILSSHIQIYADVLDMLETKYFIQAGATDERAGALPLPNEILGQALRYVTAHEVGHGLGLRHNHRASQIFTVEQLRDPKFTAQYGTSPSIMSYGRFNYIAQPGDGVTHFMPKIGPYDLFAIHWGYAPVPGAGSTQSELPTLDAWAARQMSDPYLLYGGEDTASLVDPNVLIENLGAERVEATRLGLLNLERLMPGLIANTTHKGEDFDRLRRIYQAILETRYDWLSGVVKQIGGVEETRTLAGRGDVQFKRLTQKEQKAATRFVMRNLRTPTIFMSSAVLDRITPAEGLRMVQEYQDTLLEDLLNPARFRRLMEAEQLDPQDHYPLVEYLEDIQLNLFEELRAKAPQIDASRRSLQRQYLAILQRQIFDTTLDSDLRVIIGYTMQGLVEELEAAEKRTSDLTTRLHLADIHRMAQGMAMMLTEQPEKGPGALPANENDDRRR